MSGGAWDDPLVIGSDDDGDLGAVGADNLDCRFSSRNSCCSQTRVRDENKTHKDLWDPAPPSQCGKRKRSCDPDPREVSRRHQVTPRIHWRGSSEDEDILPEGHGGSPNRIKQSSYTGIRAPLGDPQGDASAGNQEQPPQTPSVSTWLRANLGPHLRLLLRKRPQDAGFEPPSRGTRIASGGRINGVRGPVFDFKSVRRMFAEHVQLQARQPPEDPSELLVPMPPLPSFQPVWLHVVAAVNSLYRSLVIAQPALPDFRSPEWNARQLCKFGRRAWVGSRRSPSLLEDLMAGAAEELLELLRAYERVWQRMKMSSDDPPAPLFPSSASSVSPPPLEAGPSSNSSKGKVALDSPQRPAEQHPSANAAEPSLRSELSSSTPASLPQHNSTPPSQQQPKHNQSPPRPPYSPAVSSAAPPMSLSSSSASSPPSAPPALSASSSSQLSSSCGDSVLEYLLGVERIASRYASDEEYLRLQRDWARASVLIREQQRELLRLRARAREAERWELEARRLQDQLARPGERR